jgi:V-type H+-transporting ATPase subunit E
MSHEDRQIQAMIEFIERDAQEKAREYADEAQAMYDSEKANLVEAQKKKVVANSEENKKQMEINRRVARAQTSKQERMRVMEARGQAMSTLKARAEEDIRKLVKDQTKYKQLLADLLRQSATAIAADAEVVVRQADEAVVNGLLKQAQEAAEQVIGKPVTLTMSKERLEDDVAWGGVTLKSANGKVVCNNTLSVRLAHCFEEQEPTMRYFLFNDKVQM